jgi:hypothetical protein
MLLLCRLIERRHFARHDPVETLELSIEARRQTVRDIVEDLV